LIQDKATEAALAGKPYWFILDAPYRCESWAAPKGRDGKLDHNAAPTGDDLRDFVNGRLIPYLNGFTQRARDLIESGDTAIFDLFRNFMRHLRFAKERNS
jgi:type I restriction enzyme M protein